MKQDQKLLTNYKDLFIAVAILTIVAGVVGAYVLFSTDLVTRELDASVHLPF